MGKSRVKMLMKQKPASSKVKERKSWRPLIKARLETEPDWWKKKVKDVLGLVMEACSLNERPKSSDNVYWITHNLIYNERKRRDRLSKKSSI